MCRYFLKNCLKWPNVAAFCPLKAWNSALGKNSVPVGLVGSVSEYGGPGRPGIKEDLHVHAVELHSLFEGNPVAGMPTSAGVQLGGVDEVACGDRFDGLREGFWVA